MSEQQTLSLQCERSSRNVLSLCDRRGDLVLTCSALLSQCTVLHKHAMQPGTHKATHCMIIACKRTRSCVFERIRKRTQVKDGLWWNGCDNPGCYYC